MYSDSSFFSIREDYWMLDTSLKLELSFETADSFGKRRCYEVLGGHGARSWSVESVATGLQRFVSLPPVERRVRRFVDGFSKMLCALETLVKMHFCYSPLLRSESSDKHSDIIFELQESSFEMHERSSTSRRCYILEMRPVDTLLF